MNLGCAIVCLLVFFKKMSDFEGNNSKISGRLRQFQTTFACALGSWLAGIFIVWPSYTLTLYTSLNTTILSSPMTQVESSLVGSLPSLGGIVGTLAVGLLIDRIGRRNGSIIIGLPYVISWALLEISSSSIVILIARAIGGISSGAFLVLGPNFTTEVAEDSIRGLLMSCLLLWHYFGMTLSYALGWIASYKFIIRFNVLCSVLFIINMAMVIESPVYYAKKNKKQEVLEAISRYRGVSTSSKIVIKEFQQLKRLLTPEVELLPVTDQINKTLSDKDAPEKGNAKNGSQNMSQIKILFFSKSCRRAFCTVAGVLALQVFMGMSPIQIYAKDVFSNAAPNLSPHFCSVLLSLVLLSGTVVNTLIIEKVGRRLVLIASIISTAGCMAVLGLLLQFNLATPLVVAVLLLACCFVYNIGAGAVPFMLAAEVFPPEVKTLATVILVQLVWMLNFIIISLYPFLTKYLGIYNAFYTFALIGIGNAVLSYYRVPETRGLSIEQIQESLLERRIK